MRKQTDHEQAVTQYLLGALPEAETERFDELSFTDDDFAETLQAAEKDLVDAYVKGELAGTELEQFKFHYLASPLRREKVEFAQAFRAFAEKNAAAEAANVTARDRSQSASEQKQPGWLLALSGLMSPRPGLQWGLGLAALALLITGGWLFFENARLKEQVSETAARRDVLAERERELQKQLEGQRTTGSATEQELSRIRDERERLDQALKKEQELRRVAEQERAIGLRRSPTGSPSIASFVLAPQMRGASQIQMLQVPASTDYVALRLDLEPNEHSTYRVALLGQSNGRALWRSGKLRAKESGGMKALRVSLSAGLLQPQAVYILRVTGVSAGGPSETVGDYSFRAVR